MMALEYDGQRVGAMMYEGVTIGEAMIDGQIVYRSVIRVTPVAPTFQDGEPWVTLPDMEGVTYSVSGTPGYDASVTVTATAQAGYELVGTSSWSHTFGPPPRYQASGSGGGGTVGSNSWTTVTSHTVTSEGMAGGTWWFQWNVLSLSTRTYSIRVRCNGQMIASHSTSPSTSITQVQQTANIPDAALTAGDHLTFEAHIDTSNSYHRTYTAWSWSLS